MNDRPQIGSAWRASSRVRVASVRDADLFVKAHYLGKRPAVVLLCLIASVEARDVGCIIFAAPPREVEKRFGGKTWELARLYLLDDVPRNAETWLIGRAVRHIKQHHEEVAFLVSYADPSVGHQGTIYKASNWTFDGRTDAGRKTPRCDYVDARTGKKYGRRGNVPDGAELKRVPRVSKLRFKLALSFS